MEEFNLIVAGGRDYNDPAELSRELIALAMGQFGERSVSLVSGLARGADMLGLRFAQANDVRCYEFPADWDTHGKSAGYIRNAEMAAFADGLLAFWDGKSRGTAHMISVMEKAGKFVKVVRY
jgi:YspA, cpYpsA-related SLOG family